MPTKHKKYEIPEGLKVEGIREVQQHAIANRSGLLVPASFDKKKYVAKWAFVGASAEAAQLPQMITSDHEVDGWCIWKDPDNQQQPCVRPLGNKQAILLFRSKVLQQAINAINGNISKERTQNEQQGQTIEGKAPPQGLLNEQRLRGYDPAGEASETIPYSYNSIPGARMPSGGKRTSRKAAKAA